MKIGRTEILYILMMVLAVILGFIRNLSFGAILTPKFMGYYSIALTIASYGMFLNAGLMSGLARELPVALGGGRHEYAANLVGESTKAIILLQLVGLTFFYIIIYFVNFVDEHIREGFFLGGLLAFSIPFNEMVMIRLRSEQMVLSFSLLQFINAAAILLLGLLAIQHLGFRGAVWAVIVVNICSFLFASKVWLGHVSYRFFKIQDIYYLIRIGLPMMMASVFLNLQLSMDRLFLINDVSASEIGIYQIGLLPLTLGAIISGIVSQYVTPKLLFLYGQGKSLDYLFRKSLLISFIVIGIMLLVFPLVPFFARLVINFWLPAYQDSLRLILIFYLGSVFTAANIIGIVVNAANRQVLCMVQSIGLVIISFPIYLLISHNHMPLDWYAYANVILQILNFLTMIGISYYVIKNRCVACKEFPLA